MLEKRKWCTGRKHGYWVLLAIGIVSCQPLGPSEEAEPITTKRDGSTPNNDDGTKTEIPPRLVPHDPTPLPTSIPVTVPTPLHLEVSESSMRNDLISNLCISCHQAATATNRYVDLTNLTALITNTPDRTPAGQARKIVRAGCPMLSMFFLSIKNAQMPKDPTKTLSVGNVAVVEKWILNLNPDPSLVCSDEPPD